MISVCNKRILLKIIFNGFLFMFETVICSIFFIFLILTDMENIRIWQWNLHEAVWEKICFVIKNYICGYYNSYWVSLVWISGDNSVLDAEYIKYLKTEFVSCGICYVYVRLLERVFIILWYYRKERKVTLILKCFHFTACF